MDITVDSRELAGLLALVENAEVTIGQARARLVALCGDTPDTPLLSARELARVEKVGEVAHRHLAHLEAHGSLTLGQSLAIRRELYGDNVRATANLFGTKDSGALFYRDNFGPTRSDSDPVELTDEGQRIARLWRELHPGG